MVTPEPALTTEALHAHFIGEIIDATAPPGETGTGARIRTGANVAMFRCFAPSDAVEAIMASHCVTLQFLLMAAMRDAADVTLDPKTLTRARAGAMTISKTLHLWVTKLEVKQARDAARASEPAVPAPSAEKPPERKHLVQLPPIRPAVPVRIPAMPPDLTCPAIPAASALRNAMLASTSLIHGEGPRPRAAPGG